MKRENIVVQQLKVLLNKEDKNLQEQSQNQEVQEEPKSKRENVIISKIKDLMKNKMTIGKPKILGYFESNPFKFLGNYDIVNPNEESEIIIVDEVDAQIPILDRQILEGYENKEELTEQEFNELAYYDSVPVPKKEIVIGELDGDRDVQKLSK